MKYNNLSCVRKS